MTPEQLRDLYDAHVRAAETENLLADEHLERDGPVVRIVGGHRGFVSAPVDLGLEGVALEALIERQRVAFASRGEAVEWKTRAHDRPPELVARLLDAGFVAEEPETAVVAAVAVVLSHQARPPDGVELRRAGEDEDFVALGALESEVWSEDLAWLGAELGERHRTDPEALDVLLAEADGRLVAAAWIKYAPAGPVAGLWGGATLAAWRRRGLYRTLVAARARLAAARGVGFLHVDASPDSLPVLERLGFVAVARTTGYVWRPDAR